MKNTIEIAITLTGIILFNSCKQEPVQQVTPQPEKFIPTTISEQAQEFLRTHEPQEMAASLNWDSMRTEYDKMLLGQCSKIKEELQPQINSLLIEGVSCYTIIPKNYDASKDADQALVFFHGGRFTFGAGESALATAIRICDATGYRCIAVDYPLAPENPYPAALEACLKVYEGVPKVFNPRKISVIGEEAGAALALAVLLKAQEKGFVMPASLTLLSPWIDLSKSGDTYHTLADFSPNFDYDKNLKNCALAYAGSNDLAAPFISPVYSEYLTGFPATLIQTGTRDIYLSNSARLQQKLSAAGVSVQLSVSEGMWAGFQWQGIPEAKNAMREIQRFLQ